jgi:Bacteriophage baseplate protein W
MPKRILGSGWQFPIRLDKSDAIAMSSQEQKIAESISIILGTAKGERMMRPDFGCNIHEHTFSIINTATMTLIKSAVKQALVLWEPRIEVMKIDTSAKHVSAGKIEIAIDYRIRYTNTAHNLVYPFFLDTESTGR